LTNDDSGDYAMILAMLSKLEAEDTSDDSSLSKIIDLFKIDLVDGTLEQITTGKLVAAFNGLEDKFKNTNIDKIIAGLKFSQHCSNHCIISRIVISQRDFINICRKNCGNAYSL
jgi:hypothetical protein